MIARLPPVVGLAGAFALGSAWTLSGAPVPPAPLLLLALLPPILLWRRPGPSRTPASDPLPGLRPGTGAAARGVLAATVAGLLWTGAWERGMARHCLLGLTEGAAIDVTGTVVAASDGLLEVAVEEGLACTATLRVVAGSAAEAGGAPPPGRLLRVRGRWVRSAVPSARRPERAGYVRAEALRTIGSGAEAEGGRADGRTGAGRGGILLAIRAGAQERIRRTLPTGAPLAEALVLARKEAIDPGLREAFARSGTAHLLAISGFHVGVVAALLFGGLRWAGVRRRRAGVGAAVGVWAYVAVIGFPDAATRAAAILALVAAARLRSRPAAYPGALGTALLALLDRKSVV